MNGRNQESWEKPLFDFLFTVTTFSPLAVELIGLKIIIFPLV